MKKIIFVIAILALSGCSLPKAPAQPQITDNPASISQVCFEQNCFTVELADDALKMAQGLMYRQELSPTAGMLFLFPQSGLHKFWMKNTLITLDIIWLNENKEVIFISANTPPCVETEAQPRCATYGPDEPALYVLEINGGEALKNNINIGSIAVFQ